MTTSAEAYPLTWPPHVPRTKWRSRARFSRRDWQAGGRRPVSIDQSRRNVEEELRRLGAAHVVISSNLELRLDGAPRSAQRMPDDPGVAVYFQLDGKPHCMPCDKWDRPADNLRAIAKHIDSLRGQLRWGVVDVAQAFAGFKALPPASGIEIASNGPPWWNVLGVQPTATQAVIKAAFRALAAQHHPDRGGDAGAMAAINRAWEQAQVRP